MLKCPHGNGEDTHGAEGIKEVASNGAGQGRKDHLKGDRGEDRCILPAGQTNPIYSPYLERQNLV